MKLPDRGLIIREPWAGLILTGAKTMEMRSRSTNIRGRIGIIVQGTGMIYGEAELYCVHANLSPQDMRLNIENHRAKVDECIEHGWTTAWCLRKARPYTHPIPYKHPSGAVTWVNLVPKRGDEA